MNSFDYGIVATYLGVMLWLGFRFKKSKESKDYFLGGKQFGWFSLSLSVMATQLSVISFVSAPAFVGLRPGGGMQWLAFEFGVPIASCILIGSLAPSLFRSGVVSVYTVLEKRFGASSKLLLSTVFLISRSFATSIGIYAVSLILSSILGITFWQTILIIAGITVMYSFEGGMRAIVYSEVVQMIIKVLGIILIMIFALHHMGGWEQFLTHVDHSRLQVVHFSNTGFDGTEYGFWPMLLGGLFLYCSYYGVDQSQAQKILSAKSEGSMKKMLLFNGLCRFPITLTYCMAGLILGTLFTTNASFAAQIPVDKPDLMVPVFITNYLPHGIIGLLVVAMLAAAMSTFSSVINSLSAVTMEEFVSKSAGFSKSQYVSFSKVAALVWGAIIMILAFFVGDLAKTVIEAINKVGSMFYGPVLIIFILAFYFKKVSGRSANWGLIAGITCNLILWLYFPNVFWFWWNAIGACVTFLVSITMTCLLEFKVPDSKQLITIKPQFLTMKTLILIAFFVFILAFSLAFPSLFKWFI